MQLTVAVLGQIKTHQNLKALMGFYLGSQIN